MGWGEAQVPGSGEDPAVKAVRRMKSVAQGALARGAVETVEDAAVLYADALRALVAIAERGGA